VKAARAPDLPPWTARERAFLLAAVAVALALRLIHWHSVARYPWFDFLGLDAKYYDEWALRILDEGLQGKDPYFMGPLYPHVLAAIYALFGRSLDAVRAVQVLMSGATVALVHLLARRLGGPRLGCLSSAMTALYGPLVAYTVSIIYPTLNVLLTASTLLLLHEAARRASLRLAFAAGLLLGIDALGRGNVLLFAPPALVWLAAAWGRPAAPARPAARAAVLIAAAFAAGVAAGIAPATVHNLRTDDPTLLTTNGGLNFYIGNGPMASGGHETPVLFRKRPDGSVEKIVADIAKDEECRHEAELVAGRPLTFTEVSDFYFAETLRFVRENPGVFLSRLVMKGVHFWSAYEVPQIEHFHYFRRYSAVLRLPVLTFGVVGALALVGMVLLWRRRAAWALPYVFVATYSLASILFFVLDRYRIPIVPALVPFAGHTILTAWEAVRARRIVAAGAIAAGVAAAALLMRANVYGVDERSGVAQVIYRQGIVADAHGDWQAAIAYYREALDLKPDYDRCHLNLGVDLARTGRLEEALLHLDRAQELNPLHYRTPFNRGLLLEQLSRWADARDAYARAVELEPRYLLGRSALAEMLLAENRRAEARAQVDAILGYDGRWEGDQNPLARARAAHLRAYLDERDRLERAGRGGCFDASATFRLAEVARLRGRTEEALARLAAPEAAGERCAEAERVAAEMLLRKGDLDGADAALRRALEQDGSLPGVHLGMARLAAARGDGAAAVRALREEIEADPASPDPYLEMGLVLERLLADPSSARAWFARYLERGGDPERLAARREGRVAASEDRGS
jgi:tetratricopeptide (TPR) repeat protein/predicted membrane-bound mannosyltransferase